MDDQIKLQRRDYAAGFAAYIKLKLMQSRAFLLVFASLLPVCAVAASASDAVAFANARGEKAALAQFFACDDSGNEAYARVSSGSRQWLAIAVRLLPHADACYTTSLHDAIARAIVPATSGVLALVDSSPELKASNICVPFLSAEQPSSGHLAYLLNAERALQRVSAQRLQAAKRACLVEIASQRKSLRK